MECREVKEKLRKREITKAVLNNLPEWFGIEESTNEYIEESGEMVYYACFKDNEAVGFLAINETSYCTAEIYVMGRKKSLFDND